MAIFLLRHKDQIWSQVHILIHLTRMPSAWEQI